MLFFRILQFTVQGFYTIIFVDLYIQICDFHLQNFSIFRKSVVRHRL
jgi:hypothetical protein